MKKLIGVVVGAVVIAWLVAVTVTGKQVTQFLDQELAKAQLTQQSIAVIDYEWQRKGWRSAELKVTIKPTIESLQEEFEWVENFQITHGFLRSRFVGETSLALSGKSLADLYGENALTSSGTLSAEGGTIEYVLAPLNYQEGEATITHEAAVMRAVVTDTAQHVELVLPELLVREEVNGEWIDGIKIQNVNVVSQAEINDKDWLERQQIRYSIGQFSSEYLQLNFSDFAALLGWQRSGEGIDLTLSVTAPNGDYMSNAFAADMAFAVQGFHYESVMAVNDYVQEVLQVAPNDEFEEPSEAELEQMASYINTIMEAGAEGQLERLNVRYDSLGTVAATGDLSLPPGSFSGNHEEFEQELQAWLASVNVKLNIAELPELMKVSLQSLGVPNREFPWVLEYSEATGVTVNGVKVSE
ncbi:DUF945 family protein [Aliidiomarina celeris]|uniref:DUF945 family protein n=1 Tax=Aliidiomarina celeris TaxID=2249428 RepID=UPI000DEB4823|nr:DUF945 family protein [Aliidiomarina celeris]